MESGGRPHLLKGSFPFGILLDNDLMKMVTVNELPAQWVEIEHQIRDGETFLVLNHGLPAARILPPEPQQVFLWDDHPATAAQGRNRTSRATVRHDRDGRWQVSRRSRRTGLFLSTTATVPGRGSRAFLFVEGTEPSEKVGRIEDRDPPVSAQSQHMFFIPADNQIGRGGEGAFQNHLIAGIGRGSGCRF